MRVASLLALIFLTAFTSNHPSQKQNVAITDDGEPVCGSVLLTENLVLTAAHCVRNDNDTFKDTVEVRCGSADVPARVVKASLNDDLALLRLVMPCRDAEISKLARHNPEIGTEVHAIGYPGGHARLSRGIVSAYETSLIPPWALHPVLVSDTKIYYGNSGGGLFNPDNEIVGIASQLDTAGYGYWIPASVIIRFLNGV